MNQHIAVIGAGVVGMSCALWLQKKGFGVTLVDGNEPGSITSSGNACTFADYGCVPVNDPGLFRQLPSLMFRKDSPLKIDPGYALTHLPWMLSFLKHCQPREVQKTIAALNSILKKTHAGLDPLISMAGADDLITANGCMQVYQNDHEFEKDRPRRQVWTDLGIPYCEINRDEVIDLEPNLKHKFEKGVMLWHTRQTLNPKSLVTRFFQRFMETGGSFVSDHARSIAHARNGIRIYLHGNNSLLADQVVISCGAFSRQIKGCGAEKLPLDTERGYHIQYAGLQDMINRSVSWVDSGFYMAPMNEGLRCAGTVEIAGLSPKKNQRALDYITRKSRQILDLPESPTSDWLGFRPTMPDSLPVIGPSTDSPGAWYAFGHHHLGLTLAGITGRLISELIAGEPPCIDIQPFSPSRFKCRIS